MKILPADNSYSTFCDLTGGYRLFCVMAEALRSGVIDLLEDGGLTVAELLAATKLLPGEGGRFIELLVTVGLVEQFDQALYLSRFSRSFLSRTSPVSQRHVIEFEPTLMANWHQLGTLLVEGQGSQISDRSDDDCRERRQLFQRAMAEAAAVRSRELWEALDSLPEQGLIIDIGAGDATYLREFLACRPQWQAVACDLADVCVHAAAGVTPPGLSFYPCNILAAAELAALVDRYRGRAALLLFSNLCHCYSPEENRTLLRQAAGLLAAAGVLVVHDFYRDANSFGALYDLHMLVNTYNGRSYTTAETAALLADAGLAHHAVVELPSRSVALVASRTQPYQGGTGLFLLRRFALGHGFFAAVELEPARIRSEAWVRAKCAYGCQEYGQRWSCPPHAMDQAGFEELLGCYTRALLVVGQPPLRDFQEQLLGLEREAFLGGFRKALVFSGGPCCWCEECAASQCRFPDKRRPSLEACGCDVFALAQSCGVKLAPLRHSDDFVQYVGLLLVD